MSRLPWPLLLLLLLARCERDNPAYCDERTPCPGDLVCQARTTRCVSDPEAELGMPPPGRGDLRTGCGHKSECDRKHECVMGTCYRPCHNDAECLGIPGGWLCLSGPPSERCGCTADTHCPVLGTRCDTTRRLCLCGGAVCRETDRCVAGACVP